MLLSPFTRTNNTRSSQDCHDAETLSFCSPPTHRMLTARVRHTRQVKWRGLEYEESTWEMEGDLEDHMHLVQAFLDREKYGERAFFFPFFWFCFCSLSLALVSLSRLSGQS